MDDVAESIKQCSYIAPIIIDEDGVILAGHTRYKALKKLGYKECEVVIVSDLTEEQKKKGSSAHSPGRQMQRRMTTANRHNFTTGAV